MVRHPRPCHNAASPRHWLRKWKEVFPSQAESCTEPRLCNAPPGTMIDLRLSLGVWPSGQHESDWFGSIGDIIGEQ